MITKKKVYTAVTLLLFLIASAACGAEAPAAEPTQDLNILRTEVAATVLAQVTVPTCPTTPEASPTPTNTAINTAVLQPTTSPGTAAVVSGTPVVSATLVTTDTPVSLGTNRVEWASQSVADGAIFAPGETFTVTWGLKNTGTTTWTPGYMLRYYGGEPFGAPKEILINQTVLPGQTAMVAVPMIAPGLPGEYRSDWVMATDIRANFKQSVYIEVNIQRPPTNTPKPTATTAP